MNKKFIQFGGALFDAHCPKCKRITTPGVSLSVNSFMTALNRKKTPTAPGNCKKCGHMRLKFVKFEKVA